MSEKSSINTYQLLFKKNQFCKQLILRIFEQDFTVFPEFNRYKLI
jgi:hypothetical protein